MNYCLKSTFVSSILSSIKESKLIRCYLYYLSFLFSKHIMRALL